MNWLVVFRKLHLLGVQKQWDYNENMENLFIHTECNSEQIYMGKLVDVNKVTILNNETFPVRPYLQFTWTYIK